MITYYPIDYNAENVVLTTLYEDFESSTIKRSECHCKGGNKINMPDAKCYFYDTNDNVVGYINLPNNSVYDIYKYREEIILNCDEISILFLCSGITGPAGVLKKSLKKHENNDILIKKSSNFNQNI